MREDRKPKIHVSSPGPSVFLLTLKITCIQYLYTDNFIFNTTIEELTVLLYHVYSLHIRLNIVVSILTLFTLILFLVFKFYFIILVLAYNLALCMY